MENAADNEPHDVREEPGEAERRLVRPPDSRVEIERFADGLTMRVPALGLMRGTQGLFVFAIVWNSIVGIITAIIVAAAAKAVQKVGEPELLPAAFMSLFWIAGIGLLLGSINMGRRQAAIAVTGGSLMLIQTGLFGTRQRAWQPGEIATVLAGPSGMEVNKRPILELQVFDTAGRKFGLLAGRPSAELHWIAQELCTVLQLGEDDEGGTSASG